MISFDELSKLSPKMTWLPDDNYRTDFWEDLYQVFKARLLKEMQNTPQDSKKEK